MPNLITLLKRLPMLLIVFFLSANAQAQRTTVQGKVTDDKGSPLSNVSVIVKGTSTGVTTGADGSFTISVPNSKSSLVVSYVGFTSKEIEVGNQRNLTIALGPGASQLSDIVVVGYGTQKRKEITSAITTVSAEQFNKGNINDVAQLLQGKVAGLSIARPGGNPNGGFEIRLRGLSTIGAGTSPLVVVDGQIGADLNSIDPNDIKSIDVLKDGASAAIYGTRGSAGVIIVTTKGGQRGASQVTYNGSVSVEDWCKVYPAHVGC